MVGVSGYNVFLKRGMRFLKLARSEKDQLFGHLRSITEGVKELKLHKARRQAFLTEDLGNSAETVQNYQNSATDIFAISSSWGFLFLFGPLGILVFVAPNFINLPIKVQVKDGRLSTTALSQGQRKRLALLTAYLEDRSIYVFDEWASDQDPIFRNLFYTQLLPALKNRGKTVIAISHDDHYFHVADRIIKLDYGQVEYDKHSH